MALINCPECDRKVSDSADTCPNCGYNIKSYLIRQKQAQVEAERKAQQKELERKRTEEQALRKQKIDAYKGKYLGTKKQRQNERLASLIRIMKRRGIHDRIQTLIWNDSIQIATDEIRVLLERADPAMERAIIQYFTKSKPTEWNNTPVLIPPKKPKIMLVKCEACEKEISPKASSCPHCGNPTGVHVCPKCNSINTRVITGTSKAASIFLWGAFAANKVVSKYECKDCGHKF